MKNKIVSLILMVTLSLVGCNTFYNSTDDVNNASTANEEKKDEENKDEENKDEENKDEDSAYFTDELERLKYLANEYTLEIMRTDLQDCLLDPDAFANEDSSFQELEGNFDLVEFCETYEYIESNFLDNVISESYECEPYDKRKRLIWGCFLKKSPGCHT